MENGILDSADVCYLSSAVNHVQVTAVVGHKEQTVSRVKINLLDIVVREIILTAHRDSLMRGFVKLIKRITVQVINFITHVIDILDFSRHIVVMQLPCACTGTGNRHHHKQHKNKVFFKHI